MINFLFKKMKIWMLNIYGKRKWLCLCLKLLFSFTLFLSLSAGFHSHFTFPIWCFLVLFSLIYPNVISNKLLNFTPFLCWIILLLLNNLHLLLILPSASSFLLSSHQDACLKLRTLATPFIFCFLNHWHKFISLQTRPEKSQPLGKLVK